MKNIPFFALMAVSFFGFTPAGMSESRHEPYPYYSVFKHNGTKNGIFHSKRPRTAADAPLKKMKTFKVTGVQYNKAESSPIGTWKGTIKGTGKASLFISFYSGNNIFLERRYMGSVIIPDKQTIFTFNSATPTIKHWKYKVEAFG